MKPKRVVHISLGTQIGGMEKLLVEFARLTDRNHYELTFVSLQSRGDLAGQIEAFRCPVLALDKPPGVKPWLVARLAATLRGIGPQVVHTHNTAGYIYGVAAAALARVPRIIHTRHGQRFDSSTRQTMVFRTLSRFVDRVVSVSTDGHRLTLGEGIAREKASTIRNGVDLSRFPPVTDRPPGNIVVVARLSPEKQIATLIQAFELARRQLGASDRFCLQIVGDGAERERLQALTKSLRLDDVVRFHGMRHDIPELLAGASMFVLPSVTEGISLTILEAMASGLPVIACRVGGNPEVVADGESGILVAPRDAHALSAAMLRIHRDRSLARRFGSQGRQRVERHFCIRKMVRSYEALYAEEDPR